MIYRRGKIPVLLVLSLLLLSACQTIIGPESAKLASDKERPKPGFDNTTVAQIELLVKHDMDQASSGLKSSPILRTHPSL